MRVDEKSQAPNSQHLPLLHLTPSRKERRVIKRTLKLASEATSQFGRGLEWGNEPCEENAALPELSVHSLRSRAEMGKKGNSVLRGKNVWLIIETKLDPTFFSETDSRNLTGGV